VLALDIGGRKGDRRRVWNAGKEQADECVEGGIQGLVGGVQPTDVLANRSRVEAMCSLKWRFRAVAELPCDQDAPYWLPTRQFALDPTHVAQSHRFRSHQNLQILHTIPVSGNWAEWSSTDDGVNPVGSLADSLSRGIIFLT
jgi:hypothetical protein